MHGLFKRPGYRLCSPDSPEAGALLAEQGLGPADLKRALARLERVEGTKIRTIVGVNEDGVFGTSRAGWRPDLPGPAPSPSSRCSGSRSTSCSATCPRTARRGSSKTARCRATPGTARPSTGSTS